MIISIEAINLSLILLTFLMIFLDSISSNTNANNQYSNSDFLISFILVIFMILSSINFIYEGLYNKDELVFIQSCSNVFIFVNAFIFINILKINKNKFEYNKIYFLTLASVTILSININSSYDVIKTLTTTTWLVIMTTLAIKTTKGSKKAEVGVKLAYNCVFILIIGLFNLIFADILNIENTNFIKGYDSIINANNVFIFFSLMSIFCINGIPPFHIGHINCADGANLSTAFFLYSNSCILGLFNLFNLKYYFFNSYHQNASAFKILITIISLSFLIICFRLMDQSKIKRTVAYMASCVAPLVCLAVLIGNSLSLPHRVYIIGIYAFISLSLVCLFCSLQVMESINNHLITWEDISGFGRQNKLKTLCFLIAIASIAGIPGTVGYFVKLSLLSYMQDSIIFHLFIFISIGMGVACLMRMFVFFYSKAPNEYKNSENKPLPYLLIIACATLSILGLFPFIR